MRWSSWPTAPGPPRWLGRKPGQRALEAAVVGVGAVGPGRANGEVASAQLTLRQAEREAGVWGEG
jgi:hypothetical protein